MTAEAPPLRLAATGAKSTTAGGTLSTGQVRSWLAVGLEARRHLLGAVWWWPWLRPPRGLVVGRTATVRRPGARTMRVMKTKTHKDARGACAADDGSYRPRARTSSSLDSSRT